MTQHFSAFDTEMMATAISLAKKGQFTTSPNPNVGCVILDSKGHIVGQGWHHKAGTPHAEIHALEQAGERAKDGTAYVTLEPCSHFGKTPPCADALIAANIKRVVVAMVDPNPLVSGKGLEKLAHVGVEVSQGLLASQAEKLNRGFIKRMRTGMPHVTVKLAASLDGKTALANGISQWITSPAARADVQRYRALSCAILSGSGTVMSDDPSLNVRYEELGEVQNKVLPEALRQPIRVILDGRNQLKGERKTFSLPGQCWVVNRLFNPELPASVEQLQVQAKGNKLDLNQVMSRLGERQINNIWVEAGGMLAGALLQENLIDELILYQAPKLMGDKGQNLFVMQELTSMEQTKKLSLTSTTRVGNDLKIVAKVINK